MRAMILQLMKGLTRGQVETSRASTVARLEVASDSAGCDAVLFLDGWEDARAAAAWSMRSIRLMESRRGKDKSNKYERTD